MKSLLTRRQPAVLVAGALGSLALALSTTGTLSGFTAQITNSTNTAASGYLTMKEVSGTTTCNSTDGGSIATNTATCASINKYGGTTTPLAPGSTPSSTSVTITNTGTVAATGFTLTPSACSATAGTPNGGASTPCSKLLVKITSGTTTVYNGAASAMPASINLLTALGQSSIAAGGSATFKFDVSLDPTADNTYAGFTFSQPLAWTFNA